MNIYQVNTHSLHPWTKVRLRVLAYTPTSWVEETLKVVVQVWDSDSQLVTEDPIAVDWMLPMDFLDWMARSIREGWDWEPCSTSERIFLKKDYDAYQRRSAARSKNPKQ